MTTRKSWNAPVRLCCGLVAMGTAFTATGCDDVEALVAVARTAAGQTIAENVSGAIGDAVDGAIGGGLGDLLGNPGDETTGS